MFFQHAAVFHGYLLGKSWADGASYFVIETGETAVSLFFLITAYLFWSRAVRRNGRMDFLELYLGRIFRIGPLYLLLAAYVLITAMALSGWRLQMPLFQWLKSVFQWLCFGVLGQPDVNGVNNTSFLALGVTWTLKYEWIFYISLLVTSFLARLVKYRTLIVGAIFIVAVVADAVRSNTVLNFVALFLGGMLCASLKEESWVPVIDDRILSVIAAIGLFLNLAVMKEAYNGVGIFISTVTFLAIARGATLFGLLQLRSSRRLGDISFGIYLLQGPVFHLILLPAPVRAYALTSPLAHWSVFLLCAIVLVTVAVVAHKYIELPGIKLGKSVLAVVRAHMGGKPRDA